MHITWDRKHLCSVAPADASCGEPGGASETGVHIGFFVVSLLLLLILLEIQTSVLAQGHVEMFHRPRAAQGLVC